VDVQRRLDAVEEENAILRERVAALESSLVGDWHPPLEWRLTESEGRVFGALMQREEATKNQIMHAVYAGRIDDEPEMKIVDVFICKIRKKIELFNVEIETIWGRGYRIPPNSRAWLREKYGAPDITRMQKQ